MRSNIEFSEVYVKKLKGSAFFRQLPVSSSSESYFPYFRYLTSSVSKLRSTKKLYCMLWGYVTSPLNFNHCSVGQIRKKSAFSSDLIIPLDPILASSFQQVEIVPSRFL